MPEEKASKEGYGAGRQGESHESNPYRDDSVTGRMFDTLTYQVHHNDAKADAWESGRGAGGRDEGKKK